MFTLTPIGIALCQSVGGGDPSSAVGTMAAAELGGGGGQTFPFLCCWSDSGAVVLAAWSLLLGGMR